MVPGILNKAKFNIYFHSQAPSRAYGFTLLELLIVIVIVSILFSFVSLTIRSHSPEDLIKEEAHRFNRLIQLALEESVMKNQEYGLELTQNSYRFLTYTNDAWQAIEGDKLLRQRELPGEMEIEMEIEQLDIIIGKAPDTDQDGQEDIEEAKPQIFLLSSEEITPEFSVRFKLHGIDTSYIVTGSSNGEHEVKLSDL